MAVLLLLLFGPPPPVALLLLATAMALETPALAASASAATVAASSVREGFRSRRWIAPLCVLRLLFGLPILVVLVPPTIAIPLFIAEAA